MPTPRRDQLARLLRLLLALRSGHPNAQALAELCEVSRRTVFRDLESLELAGIPVRYRADRQGYELGARFGIPTAPIDEAEAFALMVLVRQHDPRAGGHLRDARSGLAKVLESLAPEARARIAALAETIEGRGEPIDGPVGSAMAHGLVLESLRRRLQLRAWFQQAAGRESQSTKLGPYRLILARRGWYVIGRSTADRGVRTFRVASILRAVLTDDPYAIPPRFDLDRYLGRSWSVEGSGASEAVRLRFSSAVAREIVGSTWHPSQRVEPRDDGSVDLAMTVGGLEEIRGWVLEYGDTVQVLAPDRLRRAVCELALRIARLNRDRPAGVRPPGPAVPPPIPARPARLVDSAAAAITMATPRIEGA